VPYIEQERIVQQERKVVLSIALPAAFRQLFGRFRKGSIARTRFISIPESFTAAGAPWA
jgi:hypothetical protein